MILRKTNIGFFLFLSTLSVANHANAKPSFGTEVNISSISLSEPVTIKTNFDDWETDEELKPGNRLYSKQVARAGFTINRVHLGYTKQLYYYLNFSHDTALLHYRERNNIKHDKTTFDIYLNANNAEAEGFYLGYTVEWKGLSVNATLNYLDLEELYYGEAFGFFDPAETASNRTEITIDYAYPEDRIFDRPVDPPEGTGITLDLNIQYSWREHSFAALIGEAYSDLYWNTAPGSRIEGNLNSLLSDDEAAIRYSHFRAQIHQRLPVHTQLHYRYRLNPQFSAGLNHEKLDNKRWTTWAGDWHITPKWTGSVLWNPDDSIWGLQIKHPHFAFGLASDSSDYRKSHYLKLQLEVHAKLF